MIHAFVHTQGVFFNQIYYPLELAYVDVLGDEAHFILTSPLSFHETKRSYPHARPDAIMTTGEACPIPSRVVSYTNAETFERLVEHPGDSLRLQGVWRKSSPTVAIRRTVRHSERGILRCSLHTSPGKGFGSVPLTTSWRLSVPRTSPFKCALRAVRLVWYVLHHDRVLTSESQ